MTNHNYGHFLRQCLDSALEFCDEVLVYEDASTDDSREVIASYGNALRVYYRDECSGGQMWGFNAAIDDARCTHMQMLDADNYLISMPHDLTADYTYAQVALLIGEELKGTSTFQPWATAKEALDYFIRDVTMPLPAGGIWSLDFIRRNNLRWLEWEPTQQCIDYRSIVEWLRHDPTLEYRTEPFMAFRLHPVQQTANGQMNAVVRSYATQLAYELRGHA